MKKRIILFCTLLALAALAIAGAITLLAVQRRYVQEARAFLSGTMDAVLSLPIDGGYDAFAREKAAALKNGARITFIGPDGDVLGDSESDYQAMENHAGREEFRQALIEGSGEAIRRSATTGKEMLYMAKALQDGVVARFSIPLANEQIFLMDILPSMGVAVLVSLLIAFAAANLLMKRLLRPFYKLRKMLKSILSGKIDKIEPAGYDEMTPVVDGLNEMLDRIDSHIASVRQQTEKIDNIIRHMQEGLILLDENGQVLLSNDAAKLLLGLESDPNGKKFSHLVRNAEINDALRLAVQEKKPSVLDIHKRAPDRRVLRIFVSPVQKGAGAIMFINDITELKKAENVRREFTANVSHELKTPLTTIRGFAELLSTGMVEDGKTRARYARLIMIESERLINIINDILRLSELDESSIPVHSGPVDLLETAMEVCELLSEEAVKREVALTANGAHAVVDASADHIKELVLNLVDNAIKYNRRNGRVNVTVAQRQGNATLTVEDNGIGIPPEHQQRIFERFYRVDKGRSKSTGGTGLGLSIVKHIAELYHGEIALHSEPGEGTKIEIRFPLI